MCEIFAMEKLIRNFGRISNMACPRGSCRIELGATGTNLARRDLFGPHETYIPFGNYRYSLLTRTALCANPQVNTGKNRCLR